MYWYATTFIVRRATITNVLCSIIFSVNIVTTFMAHDLETLLATGGVGLLIWGWVERQGDFGVWSGNHGELNYDYYNTDLSEGSFSCISLESFSNAWGILKLILAETSIISQSRSSAIFRPWSAVTRRSFTRFTLFPTIIFWVMSSRSFSHLRTFSKLCILVTS